MGGKKYTPPQQPYCSGLHLRPDQNQNPGLKYDGIAYGSSYLYAKARGS